MTMSGNPASAIVTRSSRYSACAQPSGQAEPFGSERRLLRLSLGVTAARRHDDVRKPGERDRQQELEILGVCPAERAGGAVRIGTAVAAPVPRCNGGAPA